MAAQNKFYMLNPYLKRFWRTRSRYKVIYGGRASGKSHDAAGMAVYLAANYTLKFLCARQFQNRISESVYALIKDKIEKSEYKDEFEILKTTIRHKKTGSEFIFLGIARNLSEIKSLEGVDILWLEEAHYLTKEQWEVIEPTIRKEGSSIWIIFNPNELADFAYQNFVLNPPPDTVKVMMNFPNNPYLSETMMQVIRASKERDPDGFNHIYLGQPKTGGDKSVINLKFILSAIDAHKKIPGWEKTGQKRIGYDVADDGDDLNATCSTHGNIIDGLDEWQGLEDKLLESATRVFNEAMLRGASVTYDSIGVGAAVGNQFANLNKSNRGFTLEYDAFNAGGAVRDPKEPFMVLPHTTITNADHFSNIKAQAWTEVAQRFFKTYEAVELGVKHPIDELISIDKDAINDDAKLNRMCLELSSPRKDIDLSGRFKVESKKDMKEKRKIKSPNMADAVIMAAMKPLRAPKGWFDF